MKSYSTGSKAPNRIVRVAVKGSGEPKSEGKLERPRAKLSGQAVLFIALSMVVIIALVGLAVDGGSIYNQRRTSQNGTDAAAMDGTRLMLVYYEWMAGSTSSDDDNWPDPATAAQREDAVRDGINQYATSNGLTASSVEAYFVNDSKQVVTVNNGEAHNCGIGVGRRPCKVGENGVIPWQEGAKGILVKGSSQANTFFMGIMGWNQVSASANSTAFMGVVNSTSFDIKLLPVGFFTDTQHADNFQPQHTYTLIAKSNGLVSGQWGWLDYNGHGATSSVLRAWEDCGFNPSITAATWPIWCPRDANSNNTEGPLLYYTGWPLPDTNSPYYGLTVRFGYQLDGWWLHANSGDINAGCANLQAADGALYIVPVFDAWTGSGSNTYYHLYRMAQFLIHTGTINCNKDFEVDGVFQQEYMPGSSGWHGDLRHNSLHNIFMSP